MVFGQKNRITLNTENVVGIAMISTRYNIITCLLTSLFVITSGCISFEEETSKKEDTIVPQGWENTSYFSINLTIDYEGREKEVHKVDLYVTNDLENLRILVILHDDDYNSRNHNVWGGKGDVFRILIDCYSDPYNDTFVPSYLEEDSKVVSVGIPDELNWVDNLADEQFFSLRKAHLEGNGGWGKTATFVGSSDFYLNGTVNFNASIKHTNPFENELGDYIVEYTIPIKGNMYENTPIDLFSNVGDTVQLVLVFTDEPGWKYGSHTWNYTLEESS